MNRVYIHMSVGEGFGWAVCGKNLVREMEKIADVRYIGGGFKKFIRDAETQDMVDRLSCDVTGNVDSPFIHVIDNITFTSCLPYRGKPNIGYMFYEEDEVPDEGVKKLNDSFDYVVAGSNWLKEVLENNGVKNVVSIPQGVDRKVFYREEKEPNGKFIIFSGGKYEYRKGQDIVIDAVSLLQKDYSDVYLLASWVNLFMPAFYEEGIRLAESKLDMNRVMLLPILNQRVIKEFMSNTDIGFFPNRCEGGTNLALMEYLACGRPVVASDTTGQKDVLNKDYMFENLKEAYLNRDKFNDMGKKASDAMDSFSWAKMAERFNGLCGQPV